MTHVVDEREGEEHDAPCWGLDKNKDPFRSTPHAWRSVMKKTDVCDCAPDGCDCLTQSKSKVRIEVCDACGGVRSVQEVA